MKPAVDATCWPRRFAGLGLASCLLIFSATNPAASAAEWKAGFAKRDITPTEPLRTSGYGSRNRPSEGVDTPLLVRVVCLQSADADGPAAPMVLVTIDNIGLSGEMTRELATQIEDRHGIKRDRIVFSNTHTHSGPELNAQLSNIYTTPLTDDERAAAKRYREQLHRSILKAVSQALADRAPAELAYGSGQAGFAVNRRVLKDGLWSGFGVQADGPVDHTVPVLRISGEDGAVRGVIFNYACHCTTVGGDYYKINADWAGYAATNLEAAFDGAVALCTIGCGADANPDPRGAVEMAQMHGETLANEVARVLKGDLRTIDAAAETHFDYAALSFDLPTREELEQRLADGSPQTRRHAEHLIKVYREKGRLPATYPVPIQSWKFGDQLTMIFLGGEVVVDYTLRLRKVFDDPSLWVSAYCNDVMGYVASERMIAEGGYEYDRSGVFYSLAGPWASGTEDLLIDRVVRLVEQSGRATALSPDAALESLQVADGYRVELVAAEPLVHDPVNVAFDDRGRLWVVEMGDYPEGEAGGTIKTLTDADGDGRYETVTTFLSGLDYPTGVQPWGDGVLISAAPEILWAEDTDGDGAADRVEPLFEGFPLANPQHRINGFTYGLDHTLHLASGDNLGTLKATRSGREVNARGHDVKIDPRDWSLQTTSGRSQFVRSRDAYGRWFGNSNSRPMFQYPIEDRYLKRNAAVSFASNTQSLFTPAVAPPVFPLTAATERFNDLFAANRFTSACSSIVAGSPYFRADGREALFVCEPVHNLVHRSALVAEGSTFRAERMASETDREFLASTDPWFRPVRAAVGPDGMLYVVDMYREVIEHPEWIPDAWQQRLNLRAGERHGRIYRVVPAAADVPGPAPLEGKSLAQLLDLLGSPIAALRDQVQARLLRTIGESERRAVLESCDDANPWKRLHAVAICDVRGWLTEGVLLDALDDPEPGPLLFAIRLCEPRLEQSPKLLEAVAELAGHSDASVALQAALTLGAGNDRRAAEALATVACRDDLDRWLADAVICSSVAFSRPIAETVLNWSAEVPDRLTAVRLDLLRRLIVTATRHGESLDEPIAASLRSPDLPLASKLKLAECTIGLDGSGGRLTPQLAAAIRPLQESAEAVARDAGQSEASRCQAVNLISLSLDSREQASTFLLELLAPQTPVRVQCQAIDGLITRGGGEAAGVLLGRWAQLSNQVRQHLISQLLSTRWGGKVLLDALEAQRVNVNDLTPSARQQLLTSGDRSMKVRAARLLNRSGSVERAVLVRQYLAEFSSSEGLPADQRQAEVARGAALYQKHCAACHVAAESRQPIGASLENLTNRADEVLVQAILDPNAAVEPKYQNYVIQTDEGKTLAGVIESEVADSLTLAHADGKRTTVRRSEIERIKATGVSLMPEGFETTLSPAELQAVVRYLQQLR